MILKSGRPLFLLPLLVAAPQCTLESHARALLVPSGTESVRLTPLTQTVEATIHAPTAETTITTTYLNPNWSKIEADFIFAAPPGAVVTGFAYWYEDEKVIGRIVEKGRAAAIYRHITTRMRDPALVEMIGKNTFRARIFPVEPYTDLKIEIKMVQTLSATRSGMAWRYPLKEEFPSLPLKKFELQLKVPSGTKAINNFAEPVHHEPGKPGTVTLKRTDFLPKQDFVLTLPQAPKALNANLFAARASGTDGFFMLSLVPNRNIQRPKVTCSGGPKLMDLYQPQMSTLRAGQAYTLVGRYRGTGLTTVRLGHMMAKVNFTDQAIAGNAASRFWGARHIEQLSRSARNRDRVLKLSHIYGLPSRWSSWLAIPKAELARFKEEKNQADRQTFGTEYARAITDGKHSGAAEAKQRFEATILDTKYSTRVLNDFLNDELERVNVRLKFAPTVEKKQLLLGAKRLQVLGAIPTKGGEPARKEAEARLKVIAEIMVQAAENGKGNPEQLARLKLQAKSLGETNLYFALEDAARPRLWELSLTLIKEQIKAQPDAGKVADLQAKIKRLPNVQDELMYTIKQAKLSVGEPMAREYLVEKYKAAPDKARLAELEKKYQAVEIPQEAAERQLRELSIEVLRPTVYPRIELLLQKLSEGTEEDAEGNKLQAEYNHYKSLTNDELPERMIYWTGNHRAHYLGYLLAKERKAATPDKTKIAQWEAELKRASKWGGNSPASFESVEADRIENWNTYVVYDPSNRNLNIINDDGTLDIGLRGSHRAGDPLISVTAPADSVRVVAILPSGEIKTLAWNDQKEKWEGRFDIPTYATEGQYTITIIVMEKTGLRRQFKMAFRVDMTAPEGIGSLQQDGANWSLSVAGTDDVNHVDAFLPWGIRVPMKRGNGTFSAQVAVPSEWQNRASIVRYILTDNAHNRTEIEVNLEQP